VRVRGGRSPEADGGRALFNHGREGWRGIGSGTIFILREFKLQLAKKRGRAGADGAHNRAKDIQKVKSDK